MRELVRKVLTYLVVVVADSNSNSQYRASAALSAMIGPGSADH